MKVASGMAGAEGHRVRRTTRRRLKVCHNARCHEVFFDQSKNNSRTWFDTVACANALNLRAYRERRKTARFSDLSERDPG
jgi:predicted RNA-binding Zn ribbon-like protein